ncbi:MAG TPA: helix-turn-helix transcriptional regulator [Thermoanaerobaculia bacterium]|nr:helix-turn-helix transcriptional regulator [Thermoanaerobaculia bacterium]
MAKARPTAEGAVLRFFRFSHGLTEQDFVLLAGVTLSTLSRWEKGKRPLTRQRLGELLAPLHVPPEAIDSALLSHRLAHPPEAPLAPTDPPADERRLISRAAAAAGWSGAQAAHAGLTLESRRRQAREHRLWAEERWTRLERLSDKQQDKAVQVLLGDERSWALAERLCNASATAAAHRASDALRLARLAVFVAEQSPGPESCRLRLRGWCEPFLANALRVGGDLPGSERTFANAEDLWERGAGGDPAGLLDPTRRLDLRASLLRQLGQFGEAVNLIDQALAGSPPDAAARLLIQKAATHTRAGDYDLALEVLGQAEPKIDPERKPRLLFLHRSNWALNLCNLDRYESAEPLIVLVEALVAELGNELDGLRVRWLKGRTWAGLGRRPEALAALTQVRQYFRSEEIAYDFALASLEVAVLYLEQGRTRLVRELSQEMLWIFEGQKVHAEALAALALFRQAAEEDAVQAEWTRRLIKYLYRAQYNPNLRFEP